MKVLILAKRYRTIILLSLIYIQGLGHSIVFQTNCWFLLMAHDKSEALKLAVMILP